MELWECVYIVHAQTNRFKVTDWIWSTTKPDDKSIGHYWSSLFEYPIDEYISCEKASPDIDLKNLHYKLEVLS